MKKRVLSMVLALSMMLTLFPASAFAAGDTGGGISPDNATPQSVDTENATKKEPDNYAYRIQWNGQVTDKISLTWEDCKGKTLADLGLTAVKADGDTNDYGEATVQFYPSFPSYGSPNFTKNLSADTSLEAGQIYFAFVVTAGNTEYYGSRCNGSQVMIVVSKLSTKKDLDPSYFSIKISYGDGEGSSHYLDGSEDVSYTYNEYADFMYSIFLGTNAPADLDKSVNSSASILFKNLSDENATWVSRIPMIPNTDSVQPGTYAVAIKVPATNAYNGADLLTCDAWKFTISAPQQDPDAANYVVRTKNATDGKMPTDAVTAGDTYSIVIDVSDTGFNAGAAPYNEECMIKYRAAGTEAWDTTLPTKPGTYYVQFYVEGNKNFNAGWVSGEYLKFTIGKPALTLNDFGFSQSAGVVYQNYTITDETLSITTVYYDENDNEVTDLDTHGQPKNLGTYKVGFRVAESNTYQAYDSNGPVSDWTYTVKPAPKAENFKVELTVNNTSYDLDKVTDTVVVPYSADYDVNASEKGSSTSMVYPCYRKASEPDAHWTLFESGYPTKPGTYQIGLEVSAYSDASYGSGYVTKDNWVFTIDTPKQDPPENAYVPRLNGDSFINPSYEDVKGKTLAELGIEAERNIPNDTTDYGKTSLHFYSEYSYDSGFGAEISADTIPEVGKTYYVTVKTAGNDAYNAREYTKVFGFITVRYAPKADNYKVTVTFDGTEYDLANVTDTVVVPSGTTYTVSKTGRNEDAGHIFTEYYRNVNSTEDTDWSGQKPTEPGTYQISLEVSDTNTYNSALHLTSDKWVFTIGTPKSTPDADAYAVTYNGSKQGFRVVLYSEVEENNYKTLGDLPLSYVANEDVDVSKYGKASLHYYKAIQNKGDLVSDLFSIDYDTAYQATEALTPGAVYYVVVETAENDDYTAARYTDNGMYILIGKPDPEAANYGVLLAGDGPLTKDSSVSFGSSWRILAQGATGSGTGTVEKILYRNAEDETASWSDKQPTVPGTYEIALKVAEGDKYASASALTCDDWRVTINKGELDLTEDTLTQYVDFDNGKVVSKDDQLGEVTTLYYDADGNLVADLDEDGLPKAAGQYTIGFKVAESDYYKAIPETKTEWTYTVKADPTADLYEITLNGQGITMAGPIDYAENLATRSEIHANSTSMDVGNVTAYHYVMVKDGQPDTSILYDAFPTVPGTYQVYLDVDAGAAYRAAKNLTDPAWQFTIAKSEPASSDFTYDPTTNTFTYLPVGVSSDDVTIQYYTEDGEPVTDFVKDANGKLVPRMAGTYQVGITVKETQFYKGGTFIGSETGWTYEKPKNFVTIDDFVLTAPMPDAEISYTGDPVTVKAEPNDNIQPVQYEVVYYDISGGYPGTKLDKAPTDAGTYTWSILVSADENTEFDTELSGKPFTITKNEDLDDAITVNVPTNVREGDESGFDVTVTINDTTLTADDLEITYVAEDGTESTEAPTKAGVHTYKITVKDTAKNYTAGSVLSGNYTIYSTEPTITGGELTTEDGSLPAPGTKVTVTAPEDTDTNVFQQWVISVDGVEVQPTKEDLKEKLGVDVEDDDAALAALRDPNFAFTMPKGKLSIYALTSNPQQEAFEKAVGTTLIVGGAAAATGAVYYFGTTAYIRSQLPEGMAVPQNREQLAVALWTLADKPATESTAVFTDVAADSEALTAIRWAVDTGVMNAKTTEDGTTFLAGNYVTRAETAYRIYKLQQQRAQ